MSITVTRFNNSDNLTYNGFGTPASAELTFTVIGVSDEKEALDAAIEYAQKEYETGRRYRKLLRSGTNAIEMLAPNEWRVTIRYGSRSSSLSTADSDTDHQVTIQSQAETITVIVPVDTIDEYGEPHPGVIDPDENGNPRGVQVPSHFLVRTETHTFSNSKFSSAYQQTLNETIDHINDSKFRGFDPGEVLFQDFSARQTGGPKGDWVVTFVFGIRKNVASVNIGKGTDGQTHHLAKHGWDYVWMKRCDYVENPGSQNPLPAEKRTCAGYADQIFPEADFGALKIGIS